MSQIVPTHSLASLPEELLGMVTQFVPKESKTVKELRAAHQIPLRDFQNPPTLINRIVRKLPPPNSPKERIELDAKIRQAALQEMKDNQNKFRLCERPNWRPREIAELSLETINRMGEKIQRKKDQILVRFFKELCIEHPAISRSAQIPQEFDLQKKAQKIRDWMANPENKPLIDTCYSPAVLNNLEHIPPEAIPFIHLLPTIRVISTRSLDTLRLILESNRASDPHQLGSIILNAVTDDDSHMLEMVLNTKRPIGFLEAAITVAINDHRLEILERLYNTDQLYNHPCLRRGLRYAVRLGYEEAVRRILRSHYPFAIPELASLLSETTDERIQAIIQSRLNRHSMVVLAAMKTTSWFRSFCRPRRALQDDMIE